MTTPSPAVQATPPVFYPQLQALRALAALGVLTTHVAFAMGFSGDSLPERLIGRLDLMVAVFFALSGFVLWRWPHPRSGSFVARRAARILPGYLVCVLVVLTIFPVAQGASLRDWALQLTLTQIYTAHGLVGGLTHLWSLSVEWAFSLLLPVLWLITRRQQRRGRCLTLLTVSAFGGLVILLPLDPDTQVNTHILPPATLCWFGGGALLAEYLGWRREQGLGTALSVAWRITAGSVAVLAWGAASGPWAGAAGFVHPSTGEFAFRLCCGVVVGVGAVMAGLGPAPQHRTPLGALLHSTGQALGAWSYSLFLWHVAVLSLLQPLLPVAAFSRDLAGTVLLWVLTVVVSVAVAAVSYLFIEQPAAQWLTGRRLGARRGRRSTDYTTTPRISTAAEATTTNPMSPARR